MEKKSSKPSVGKLGKQKKKKKKEQIGVKKEKEVRISMFSATKQRDVPGEKKTKSDKENKKIERVKNKYAYDRGNGTTHLPTVDMSCISQNFIIILFLILLF